MTFATKIYNHFIRHRKFPHTFTPSGEVLDAVEAYREEVGSGTTATQERAALHLRETLKEFLSKGISLTVLRNALGDCTNRGLSSRYQTVYLVGEGVPRVQQVPGDAENVLLLERRALSSEIQLRAVPAEMVARGEWPMMGGNYVTSSGVDFRRFVGHPLPIHDRVE